MFRKLRRHLIRAYTLSAGFILLLALFVSYQWNQSIEEKSCMERLVNIVNMLSNQLTIDNVVNGAKLSEIECENECIIYIEDNGNPLTYQGDYSSKSDRNELIEKLRKAAEAENINTNIRPVTQGIIRSNILNIEGKRLDKYYGNLIIIPKPNTFLTIMVLYSKNSIYHGKHLDWIIYITIGLIGIGLLYLISRVFVGKTLQPVVENNKKQSEFVACASHELRSPLAYIKAANSTLAKKTLPFVEEEHREYLNEYIQNTGEECNRMSKLIEDMLLLASADQKTWIVRKESVDIDNFLIETYEKLLPVCEAKEHTLSIDLPDNFLGHALMDPNRIYQVIQILVNNSLSYAPIHTDIALRAVKEKRSLEIFVVDHGKGITDEEKKRIFERYYRADQAHNDRNHFGLGLSIAKELIELHEGKIQVMDTPGGGTTFCVVLPMENNDSII